MLVGFCFGMLFIEYMRKKISIYTEKKLKELTEEKL